MFMDPAYLFCKFRIFSGKHLRIAAAFFLQKGVGFRMGRVGIHDQVGAAGQVVDNDQFIDLQQHDIGRTFFLASRILGEEAVVRLENLEPTNFAAGL